ncbi:MAG: VWA domain-containing protein [Phycisphaerae bacterium]|nr:VWA domain-containing protein [Saprospiraceae bacterium]
MKKNLFHALFLFLSFTAAANGVAIVDAEQGIYLQLLSSSVQVQVQNQVAITTTTQVFRNGLFGAQSFKYGFPMPSGGSAVGLRWQVGGIWHVADFNAEAQDTTLPGGGGGGGSANALLSQYLGAFPLYFQIENAVPQDSLITIELSYVELLPYKNGTVTYRYPGKYLSIQNDNLVQQHFDLILSSGRKIEDVAFISHPTVVPTISDYEASMVHDIWEQPASADFQVAYVLSADDLGLFNFSIFLSDTLDCDDYGNGFCAFVVEPNPNPNGDIIPKVFTLIIDRSGSMSGEKMAQAREGAAYIVNNLNTGDLFNVVDFDDQITSFKPDHVPYTPANRNAALNFIAALTADGSTNISGAFSTAVPQFANDNGNTYNIIIFFTDGVPTAGITDPAAILSHINNLIAPLENDLSIFTFGVGADVNKPLLTQIANQYNGIAQFLDNNELASSISEFYQTVRNPVLLNTSMSFDPNLVYETYPLPLPNLYKGSQMLVVGRYNTPGLVNATFNGTAFGAPVTYNYPMVLTDKDSVLMRFLPKIWAKQKAEYLLQQYYAATDPALAEALKAQIQHLSICYGVLTSLTSFIDNSGGTIGILETPSHRGVTKAVQILSVSPNPATTNAQIQIELRDDIFGEILIEVCDLLGRKVASFPLAVNGAGIYTASWDIASNLGSGAFWIKVLSENGSDASLIWVR